MQFHQQPFFIDFPPPLIEPLVLLQLLHKQCQVCVSLEILVDYDFIVLPEFLVSLFGDQLSLLLQYRERRHLEMVALLHILHAVNEGLEHCFQLAEWLHNYS